LSEREYDLVVVGAGPAGSSAAYAAAKNGIKVALLEKEENVAQTVRTSGVTWIDYAKEFGIPEDCYNPIRTYKFCSPNNTISISDNQPKAAVLDVRKTYRFLADQAKKNGAEIFVNTNVTKTITENGKVVGRATGGDFGFRLNKSIALGMVKPELAKTGQKLKIDILGKMHDATILDESPYDPENKLLRA